MQEKKPKKHHFLDRLNELYSITSPELKITPPIISVIQCTPDTILPTTINIVKAMQAALIMLFSILFPIRLLNCITAVLIIHITNKVVDDGYEASR